jgi:hypothetical protein
MFAAALLLAATIQNPIDAIVKAYGGANAWAAVQTIRETGKVRTTMRGQDGALTRELKRPDRLSVIIEYPTQTEVREVQGKTGTRDGEPVQGPQLWAMVLQAARMDIPSILMMHRDEIVDRGTVERDHRTFRAFDIPLQDGLVLTIEADPKTWRVEKTIGSFSMPNGKRMAFETLYDDFRVVDGRLFAFREVSIAGGTVTGETLLAKIEVKLSGRRT